MQAISSQSEEDIDHYLDLLEQVVDVVEPVVEKPVVLKDAADDPILYTAVAGKAEVLCTLNRSHFGVPNVQAFCAEYGLRVLTDVEVLHELLRSGSNE